jgi:hypothetical protein
MSKKQPTSVPRGPEGVPVDAPDNDAPALSPHAVSRMPRAEDDAEVFANSPEFTDQPALPTDRGREPQQWVSGSPGSGQRDDASRGLDGDDPRHGEANPSHDTRKAPETAPRGRGDSELMDQPDSTSEAREPGGN